MKIASQIAALVALATITGSSAQDALLTAQQRQGGSSIRTAIIEFDYSAQAGNMTGSGEARITLSGSHYRFERLSGTYVSITNVTVDDGEELLMWSVREGLLRVASPAASLRAYFQHTIAAYVVASFLGVPGFVTYQPAGPQTYEVMTALGEKLQVAIANGRVHQVRYRRLGPATNWLQDGKIIEGQPTVQDVILEPSDFRPVAGFELPHKLMFRYAQNDTELVNIRKYVLNGPVDPAMFKLPAQ
jgi:hypothetical protein